MLIYLLRVNMSKISSSKPLNGIKVLELSNMITCSLATMTMASQGAEVIKIEPTLILSLIHI